MVKLLEINENLNDNAALINENAESEGWIFKIKISNVIQLENLMKFFLIMKIF